MRQAVESELVSRLERTAIRGKADKVQEALDEMQAGNDDYLLAHLRVLSELALSAPQVYEQKADEVAAYLKAEILEKESPVTEVCTADSSRRYTGGPS